MVLLQGYFYVSIEDDIVTTLSVWAWAICSMLSTIHLNKQFAQNAEQLMRSRYSAFALQQIDYILETTALGQQAALDRIAIDWSQSNRWLKLEVI